MPPRKYNHHLLGPLGPCSPVIPYPVHILLTDPVKLYEKYVGEIISSNCNVLGTDCTQKEEKFGVV